MKNEIAIKAENINKTFKTLKAVDDLSFFVNQSECFGILGPNGAGKTTMMKMLYGKALRDRHSGKINVFGYDPDNRELEIKYLSGIVPQENNLDDELSVIQNLLIYAKFYGLSCKRSMDRINELLEFMELSGKKNAKIRHLSGGMKRRLTFVRSLLNNPKLLILDEPTTGLDPQVRHNIWDKIRLLKKDGVTIIITTHYMEEAYQLCDRLILMHKGKKILEGNPVDLINTNIEKYVLEILNHSLFDKIRISKNINSDRTQNRLYLYSRDLKSLEQLTKGLNPGDYYLRQSNLEDLFLKTTGRILNE